MSLQLTQVFEQGALHRLARGEPLFHCGDPVRLMFLVVDGRIDLTRQTAAGDFMILQRARSGQVLAEAFAYAPHYHCDAEASAQIDAAESDPLLSITTQAA